MPNRKNWLGDNWASLMATALGFMIVTQLSEKTDSIKLNTAALGTLNTTVALNSAAVSASVNAIEDLDERVRVIEIGGGRNE